jgi:tetratricopeptide (TPR) repeat protein
LFDDDFSEYSENTETVQYNYDDAISIAGVLWNEKSQETNHLRAENLYLKACLAIAEGQSDQAIEHLENALTFNPHYPEAALLLADELMKASRPDRALSCLRSALEMNPGRHELNDKIHAIEENLAR